MGNEKNVITPAKRKRLLKTFGSCPYDDFAMPLIDYTQATFNTATAVYPYMVKQHAGVIMGMTAVVSQMPLPYTAGFGPAGAAVEAMLRLLAAELGP